MVRLTELLCRKCGYPLGSRGSCPSCASRIPSLQVRSYARYKGRVAQALLRLKYRPDKRLASMMGSWLEELYVRQGWNVEVVVPVPLSRQKMQVRGFNQAALLAKAFGGRAGLRVELGDLRRVKNTRSQVGLDPDARWRNVEQAFRAEALLFEGANVLVLDDLFTTGATLSACAAAIRAAGAGSVVGLTVARA